MRALQRSLGLPSVIAISMGAMIGSGLFVLPGLATRTTGPSVWLAYLVAGLCVLPAALSKAELATAMPTSGGTYIYVDRAFGPLAGTIVGLGLWLSLLLKSAFALVGFGAYLAVLADVPLVPVSLSLLVGVLTLNILGARKVGRFQLVAVSASLAGLVLLTAMGLGFEGPHVDTSALTGGMHGFLAAVAFVYISYAGVTKVAAIAEEVERPERNLPLGILISLFLAMALYTLVTWVLVRVVPLADLQRDLHPIYTLATHLGGYGLGIAAALLGVLTMTSMANAGVLAASRFPLAMSRDGVLPPIIGEVHPRLMTPVLCILLTGVAMALAILFLDVTSIAKLASAFQITVFMVENLAVVFLRESAAQWYKPRFRSPGYPAVQGIGFVLGLVLLVTLGFTGVAAILGMAIPGSLLYFSYGRQRTQHRGIVAALGPRRDLLAAGAPAELSDALPSDAGAVVPLFGGERSPETLVEVAAMLAEGRRVQALHVTVLPEQTLLGAMLEEDLEVASYRRRVGALAEERHLDVAFDAVVTRDTMKTIWEATAQVHCDWLVKSWTDRTRYGVTIHTPLGWLADHLPCNLAIFRDAGVRVFREILAMPEPGPHDALVAGTADFLATAYGARVTFVRHVPLDASEAQVEAAHQYIQELTGLCHAPPSTRVVRGPSAARAIGDLTGEFDLLIMAAGVHERLRDRLLRSRTDLIARRAACSVLLLKTPRAATHAALSRHSAPLQGESLRPFLAPACVQARLEPANKHGLFALFGHHFGPIVGVPPKVVVDALWEREHSQNTAVGMGVALPHATIPGDRTWLGVYTLRAPMDYQAPDDEPVDVLFVTMGPPRDRNTHLQVLSRLSRLVVTTDLLERLRHAKAADAIVAAIDACEQLGSAAPPPTL